MKGDKNRIPYTDNILLLINLIEYDVILWVFVNYVMTLVVLKYLTYWIYFLNRPVVCHVLQKIAQHRTMLVGHKCMCYESN